MIQLLWDRHYMNYLQRTWQSRKEWTKRKKSHENVHLVEILIPFSLRLMKTNESIFVLFGPFNDGYRLVLLHHIEWNTSLNAYRILYLNTSCKCMLYDINLKWFYHLPLFLDLKMNRWNAMPSVENVPLTEETVLFE